MLLGHWYLTATGMPLAPLVRLNLVLGAATLLRISLALAGLVLLPFLLLALFGHLPVPASDPRATDAQVETAPMPVPDLPATGDDTVVLSDLPAGDAQARNAGVAFAAIQGLNLRLNEKEAEIQVRREEKEAEIDSLETRNRGLEAEMETLQDEVALLKASLSRLEEQVGAMVQGL